MDGLFKRILGLVVVCAFSMPAVADTIEGTSNNDTLNGTSGSDGIWGFGGNDYINGSGGGDTLFGGTGADSVYGQNGGAATVYDNGTTGCDTDADTLNTLDGAGGDTIFGGVNDAITADGDDNVRIVDSNGGTTFSGTYTQYLAWRG